MVVVVVVVGAVVVLDGSVLDGSVVDVVVVLAGSVVVVVVVAMLTTPARTTCETANQFERSPSALEKAPPPTRSVAREPVRTTTSARPPKAPSRLRCETRTRTSLPRRG